MGAKLHEVVYSSKLSAEQQEQGNKFAKVLSTLIPKKEDGTYDLELLGKTISNACFGSLGAPETTEARSAFIDMALRGFYENLMRQAEASPIASIAKGVINSQPVADGFVDFLNGFRSA